MKTITLQKRLSEISISDSEVLAIVNAIVNGETYLGYISYSISKTSSIQAWNINSIYVKYEVIVSALHSIGLKLKASINKNGFDIMIKNKIQY